MLMFHDSSVLKTMHKKATFSLFWGLPEGAQGKEMVPHFLSTNTKRRHAEWRCYQENFSSTKLLFQAMSKPRIFTT